MKRLLKVLSLASAMALYPVAANAAAVVVTPGTTVSNGSVITGSATGTLGPNQSLFFSTAPTITATSAPTPVTASFGDSGIPLGAFTDTFTFRLPFAATGSGSVTTSVASASLLLSSVDTDLTSVIFNGITALPTYTSGFGPGAVTCPTKSATCLNTVISLNNVPVLGGGAVNNLIVNGVSRGNGSYGGQATLAPTPGGVPEPATWGMMLLGFGAMGLTMRRRVRPTLAQIA